MDQTRKANPLARLNEAAARLAEEERDGASDGASLGASRGAAAADPAAPVGWPTTPPPGAPARDQRPPEPPRGESEDTVHPSFRKLVDKLQPDVPDRILAVGVLQKKGQFVRKLAGGALGGVAGVVAAGVNAGLDVKNAKKDQFPPMVALAFTGDEVYVFIASSNFGVKPHGLFDVWDRREVRGTARKRAATWAVTLDFADGRSLELEAQKALHGNNEDAVRLLCG